MAARLPLPTLLSQALVAFTVEFGSLHYPMVLHPGDYPSGREITSETEV
jgi:hypothetical protein